MKNDHMQDQPLVSVLIPCYNAENWILQTLGSVFAQTWTNIEIVVVNDGSKDKSLDLLQGIRDPRLRVLSQDNRGQTAALNHCLAESRGTFIQYLDADDLLHPEKISHQMARLECEPHCIATSEWARFYNEPAKAHFVPDGTWQDLAPVDWLVESWKEGGGMLFPAMWLAPRELVDRIGPWREDLTLNNDAEYFSRLVLASKHVLFCREAKAYYRSGFPGSLSGLKSDAGWRSQWKVLECCEAYLLAAEDSERTHRVLSMLWQRFAHASFPYEARLAESAIIRAQNLHRDANLAPDGGQAFKFVSAILGWRMALIMQHWYYQKRYRIG